MVIFRSILLRIMDVTEKFVEKIQSHTVCSMVFFSSKIVPFGDNVGRYCRAGEATYDKMAHVH
jgi:hypothetical protein